MSAFLRQTIPQLSDLVGLMLSYASEKVPHPVFFPREPDVALAPYKEHLAATIRVIEELTPIVRAVGVLIISYYRSPFSFSPQEALHVPCPLVDLKWMDKRITFLRQGASGQWDERVSVDVEEEGVHVETLSERHPVVEIERSPFPLVRAPIHRTYLLTGSASVSVTLGVTPGKISKNGQVVFQTGKRESFEDCCVSADASRLITFRNSLGGFQLQTFHLPSLRGGVVFDPWALGTLQQRPLEYRACFCAVETLAYTLQDCGLRVAVFWDIPNGVPIAAHPLDSYTVPDALVVSEKGDLFVMGTSEGEEVTSRLLRYMFRSSPL